MSVFFSSNIFFSFVLYKSCPISRNDSTLLDILKIKPFLVVVGLLFRGREEEEDFVFNHFMIKLAHHRLF